jgi:hypothetical protein
VRETVTLETEKAALALSAVASGGTGKRASSKLGLAIPVAGADETEEVAPRPKENPCQRGEPTAGARADATWAGAGAGTGTETGAAIGKGALHSGQLTFPAATAASIHLL